MKERPKHIVLLLVVLAMVFLMVGCDDTIQVKAVDVSSTFDAQTETFFTAFCNQYSNGDIIPTNTAADYSSYYVAIDTDFTGSLPGTITIGDIAYANRNYSVSIGMNAFLEVPVYKVESNTLYVSLPALAIGALPGTNVRVELGGIIYDVKVYATATSGSLSVTEDPTVGQGAATGTGGTASVSGSTITATIHSFSSMVTVKLGPIPNENAYMFSYDGREWGSGPYLSINRSTAQDYVEYTLYGAPYATEAVTSETATRNISTKKIVLPGIGAIELTLDFSYEPEV